VGKFSGLFLTVFLYLSAYQTTAFSSACGIDIHIFHLDILYLATFTDIPKKADTVYVSRTLCEVPYLVVVSVENAGKWFIIRVFPAKPLPNNVKLCASVLGEIDIAYEDKVVVLIFLVIADVV